MNSGAKALCALQDNKGKNFTFFTSKTRTAHQGENFNAGRARKNLSPQKT